MQTPVVSIGKGIEEAQAQASTRAEAYKRHRQRQIVFNSCIGSGIHADTNIGTSTGLFTGTGVSTYLLPAPREGCVSWKRSECF
jgi:hypothetical protein